MKITKHITFLLTIYAHLLWMAPVSIPNGGLGNPTVIAYGLLSTNGAGTAYQFLTLGSANQFLVSTGVATLPGWDDIVPGYIAGTGFLYSGSSSTLPANPDRTIIISTTAPASIDSSAADNLAIGYNALNSVQSSTKCIAIGSGALQNLTTGSDNIAMGYQAGFSLTTGSNNIAIGSSALYSNQTGDFNLAFGYQALYNNTASGLVGIGYQALYSNTSGTNNTGIGYQAAYSNQTGGNNTAVGYQALEANISGTDNTAYGYQALLLATGSYNTAAGYSAGSTLTTGSNNIYLGHNAQPISITENNNIVIGNSSHTSATMHGITGRTSTGGSMLLVNASSQLGTIVSSKKFKTNIESIGTNIIEKIELIEPVQFNYIADETHEQQYGMIAEDVEPIFPETIVYKDDRIMSIQYHKFTPLLIAYAQDTADQIDSLIQESERILHMIDSSFTAKRQP